MERNKKKALTIISLALLLTAVLCASWIYYYIFCPQFHPNQTSYVYINRDDTIDSVYVKTSKAGHCHRMAGFRLLVQMRKYDQHIHTGRYKINPADNAYHVFTRLYRGHQEPMNLTINSVRTLDRLARNVGKQLMIDSTEIAEKMNDSLFIHQYGYNQETLPSLFIPDTYQVYWDMDVDEFFQRMQKEHARFWNKERKQKASDMQLTPEEVCTLASIVEEETNNKAEKPIIAGLYLNRLKRNMLLQADPTVKFALQNFSLRRITNADLEIDSPYNTYRNLGLPPGPIRIATPNGIDAVLNHTKHNYIYMCAKEDFSGTHNFATNLTEHMNNARKYWNALNRRKIFK